MLLLLLLLSLRPLLLQLLLRSPLSGRSTPFLRNHWLLLRFLLVLLLRVPLLLRFSVCCFLRNCGGCCRRYCLPREKCRLTPRNLLKGFM